MSESPDDPSDPSPSSQRESSESHQRIRNRAKQRVPFGNVDPIDPNLPPIVGKHGRLPKEHTASGRPNPFKVPERDSFPTFDQAFQPPSSKKRSNAKLSRRPYSQDGVSNSSPRSSLPLLDPDQSTCSHTSSFYHNLSTDMSIMSIGARAALEEHRRQVTQCGFDVAPTKTKLESIDAYEREWDRLLDGNCSHASWSTHAESHVAFSTRSFVKADEEDCENSSAFFNSSRINGLLTPERNRQKVDEASRLARLGEGEVTVRGQRYEQSYVESVSGSASGIGVNESDCSGMAGLFKAAVRLTDEAADQSSFVSFVAAAEVSTLSNGNSSGSKKWSESSSSSEKGIHSSIEMSIRESHISPKDLEKSHDISTEIGVLIPPIDMTPARAKRSSPSSSAFSTPRGSPLTISKRRWADKENDNFGFWGLSPIASKAGDAAAKILQGSDPLHFDCDSDVNNFSPGLLKSFSKDLTPIRSSKLDAMPSPIHSIVEEETRETPRIDDVVDEQESYNVFSSLGDDEQSNTQHLPAAHIETKNEHPFASEQRRGVVLSREEKLRALGIQRRYQSMAPRPHPKSLLQSFESTEYDETVSKM